MGMLDMTPEYERLTKNAGMTHRKEWEDTPWVVTVFTGNDDRLWKMYLWCQELLGPEQNVTRGTKGRWHFAEAPHNEYHYWGFDTESLMDTFLEVWP